MKVFLVPRRRILYKMPDGFDSIDRKSIIFQRIIQTKGDHPNAVFLKLSRDIDGLYSGRHFHWIDNPPFCSQSICEMPLTPTTNPMIDLDMPI